MVPVDFSRSVRWIEHQHILSQWAPSKRSVQILPFCFSYVPHSPMPPNFNSSQTVRSQLPPLQVSTQHTISPYSRLTSHSRATMDEHTHREPAQDSSGDALEKQRTPVIDDDDVLAWLLMEGNESDCELLNLPEPVKDTGKGTVKVRFIENPYSSLLVFQSSLSYITINGNEESCGSSFSDSDTSMMASVDTSGLSLNASFGNVRCAAEEERTREETWVSGEGVDGCDGFYWDDQVLARFLDEQVFSDSEK
ncbi:hypothetical protein L6164_011729 [Bauhinia variegata]|uniref:Uncharacterized protein n=1 Tax=Bauhinia variegata TaxID=167791 RepID=A0ACB9P7M2_BAUVA|nr:hypothetical protein L6164_011729 [Bauhinia variegata]